MKLRIFLISLALLVMQLTFGSEVWANKKFPVNENHAAKPTETMDPDFGQFPSADWLPEEQYVNDIPFETSNISARYTQKVRDTLSLESYVNDIPFNTCAISERYELRNGSLYGLETEQDVNDIPFDTADIANQYNKTHKTSTF